MQQKRIFDTHQGEIRTWLDSLGKAWMESKSGREYSLDAANRSENLTLKDPITDLSMRWITIGILSTAFGKKDGLQLTICVNSINGDECLTCEEYDKLADLQWALDFEWSVGFLDDIKAGKI